jgi:hypothetical protein
VSRKSLHLLISVLALVIVAAGVLTGCGSKEHSYKGHGVSLHYPKNWERAKFTGLSAQNASGVWTEAFKPPSASKADVVFVTEYRTSVVITKQNRATYSAGVASSVATVAKQAGGSMLSGPTPVSMGGLPGYGFRISATTVSGLSSESRILLVWNGHTEYYVNCQYRVGGKLEAEIERGCKTVIGSFKVS